MHVCANVGVCVQASVYMCACVSACGHCVRACVCVCLSCVTCVHVCMCADVRVCADASVCTRVRVCLLLALPESAWTGPQCQARSPSSIGVPRRGHQQLRGSRCNSRKDGEAATVALTKHGGRPACPWARAGNECRGKRGFFLTGHKEPSRRSQWRVPGDLCPTPVFTASDQVASGKSSAPAPCFPQRRAGMLTQVTSSRPPPGGI